MAPDTKIFFLLLFAGLWSVQGDFPTFREAILKNPRKPYSKEDSPYDLTHQPVMVNISVALVTLCNVNELQQVVSYLMIIEVQWEDFRLQFDPNVLQLNDTAVLAKDIWVPVLFCYNCADVHRMDGEEDENKAIIFPNGTVMYFKKARMDATCQTNYERFPYDSQQCGVQFIREAGMTSPVIFSSDVPVDPAALTGNSEWQLLPEDTEVDKHGLVMIQFKLIRNSSFYTWLVILPVAGITCACLYALTWPLNFTVQDKLNFLITSLLTMCFLLTLIIQHIPKSLMLPGIGKWLLCQFGVCILALFIHQPARFLKRHIRHRISAWTADVCISLCVVGGNIIGSILLFTHLPEPERPNPF